MLNNGISIKNIETLAEEAGRYSRLLNIRNSQVLVEIYEILKKAGEEKGRKKTELTLDDITTHYKVQTNGSGRILVLIYNASTLRGFLETQDKEKLGIFDKAYKLGKDFSVPGQI